MRPGDDGKILAVLIDGVSKLHLNVNSPEDIQPALLNLITHFFEHYKDLEPDKWVKIDGWSDAVAAKDEIVASLK